MVELVGIGKSLRFVYIFLGKNKIFIYRNIEFNYINIRKFFFRKNFYLYRLLKLSKENGR